MTPENKGIDQILELLNKLDTDVRATNKKVDETNEKLDETNQNMKKWDERYFQLVRDQGNSARTIIIAAASVVVLSPVLGAVVDLVRNHLIK